MRPAVRERTIAETGRIEFAGAGGLKLQANVTGDPAAPCVILLHGGGQTRHAWSATFQTLASAGYRVIAYDSRGHGESSWSPDGIYSFSLRADDLRAIAADIVTPLALVGASMGGITSMQAINAGLEVSALVLVDIVLRPRREGVQRVRDFMASRPRGFATLEEAVDAVAAYNPHRPRPADPSNLLRNLRHRADGRLYWHWDPRMVPADVGADLVEMEDIARGFKTRSPVMLVRGSDSDVVTDANAGAFLGLVPHAELRSVPGAGHMVVGDSNREFNDAIIDFLGRHVPPDR
jgi:pimeloyl-ACP methyl ester carboxylesterase